MGSDREQAWQPIAMLPALARMVAKMIDGALEQQRLLDSASHHQLDEAMLNRVIAVYGTGLADLEPFAAQVRRWEREHPGAPGLAEFAEQVARLPVEYRKVLDAAHRLRDTTSEALAAEPDTRVGADALGVDFSALTGPAAAVGKGGDDRGRDAAWVLELVAGYLCGDVGRIAAVAGQITAAERATSVLGQANRFAGVLIIEARLNDVALSEQQLREMVLSSLQRSVPLHDELIISRVLDLTLGGDLAAAGALLMNTPEVELLLIHTITAYIAALGTYLCGPGEFTPAYLDAMAHAMDDFVPEPPGLKG